MPLNVKPAAQWKSNWDAARALVPTRYEQGILANTTWFDAAQNGQSTYESMMTNPTVLQRRLTGLQTRTSQAHWQTNAKTKGKTRISEGMAAGKPRYDSSADKSYGILSGISLPDRTADYRANITNRVIPVVEALKAGWGKL